RQADHVEVVAVDPLDERGADALDRIGAGAALPLAGRDVGRDVARVERPEHDARDLVLDLLPGRGPQTQPGDDLVRLAAERVEHRRRILRPRRLAVDAAGADDGRVDAEHGPLPGPAGDRRRLPARVLANEYGRIGVGRVVLLVPRRDDVE